MTATATTDDYVHFGLVELDLLSAHAGARFPFPLRVPEFGRVDGERQVLLAAAGVTLRVSGLADLDGPVDVAAELVTALRECRGTVDLILAGPGAVAGVVALTYGSSALICRQRLVGGQASAGVWIRRVAQNALVDELLAMVPVVAPAQAMPVTFPLADDKDEPADPDLLDDLAGLVGELTGSGQLGATRHGERHGTELSWLDGPRGRLRVSRAKDGWLSVNPLRRNDIRLALDDLTMIARREHDGT